MSFPFKIICPFSIGVNPVIPYTNSDCPFPSIPATQRISPLRTAKDTSFTACCPSCLEAMVRFFTSNTGSPGVFSGLSTWKLTFRPTIISDIASFEVSATSIVPIYFPFLSTLHRFATSLISFSLCVMNIMDFPSATSCFITFISSWISCGVNTAVGSSKIKISLSQ